MRVLETEGKLRARDLTRIIRPRIAQRSRWCPAMQTSIVGRTGHTLKTMPELPDVTVYVEAIHQRVHGQPLSAYAILSPFVLRTVEPTLDDLVGRVVTSVERM